MSGGGGVLLVRDQRVVGGAVDHAVRAVGRQGGQVVVGSNPVGITSAAGCQDDQGLVGEVIEGRSLPRRGVRLEVLVDRALQIAGGRPGGLSSSADCGGKLSSSPGEQRPTPSGRGREQCGDTAHDVVGAPSPGDVAGVAADAGAVESISTMSGDVVGILGGEGEHVEAAEGVAGQHVGSRNVSALQQGVEVGRYLRAVLGAVSGLAPAVTCAVVDADAGLLGDGRGDPPEIRRHQAGTRFENHGGAA